jgi:long-chain acyl-CoA synthetase
MEEEAVVALNPASIPAILIARAATYGADIALRKKDYGIWKATTWSELDRHVREVGAGLRAIGFRSGDVACVIAETRPEWAFIDLGILGAGGVSGGIHPEQEPEALGQTLIESDCRVLFVENEEQLDKALLVRGRCAALQRIVIIDMKGLRGFADPMCESLQSFVARGPETAGWDAGIAAIEMEQPAVLLVPRSGASRTLTHGDALHLIARARPLLGLRAGDERLALLPMCHVMERVLGLYLSLDMRVTINYLENPDTAVGNLQEVQPTVLATDARIWELLHARVERAAATATSLQRFLYRWAIVAGTRGGTVATLARFFVLHAVRRELGLSRLRVAYLGGTRLAPEIEHWALSLGISIRRLDGQTRDVDLDARYHALMQEAYGT